MSLINDGLAKYGIQTANILVPNDEIDKKKWAVIACDQYSSESEYWENVKDNIKDSPSTLNLVFPECYLEKGNDDKIITSINNNMDKYLKDNIFSEIKDSFILIKRELRTGINRWGLIVALDLDKYDFSKDSKSLIRATEGTIIERIPPRLKIRENAKLELPHIMVLVDDKSAPLITPLIKAVKELKPLYETELMQKSGKISGYKIDSSNLISQFEEKLKILSDKDNFFSKYNKKEPLLFAIGDGNHSLATAKTQWLEIKKNLSAIDSSNIIANHIKKLTSC